MGALRLLKPNWWKTLVSLYLGYGICIYGILLRDKSTSEKYQARYEILGLLIFQSFQSMEVTP